MGVGGLWNVLDEFKETESIHKWRDKVIAIDLSIWIKQGQNLQHAGEYQYEYQYLRTIFERCAKLVKHGIRLIGVLDGKPNIIKNVAYRKRYNLDAYQLQHSGDFDIASKKVQELLECMAIPVIRAEQDAEATCAILESKGFVEAVQSRDGDAFCYGARTVIKDIHTGDNSLHKGFEVFRMNNPKLLRKGINRKKLISIAILNQCDFTNGIHSIGPKTVLNVLQGLEDKDIVHFLRSLAQKTSFEIPALGKKPPHCSQCKHVGRKKDHAQTGCRCCSSETGCRPKNGVRCSCEYHMQELDRKRLLLKENLRKKVSGEYDEFPQKGILEHFENPAVKYPEMDKLFEKDVDLDRLRVVLGLFYGDKKKTDSLYEYAISFYLNRKVQLSQTPLKLDPTFDKCFMRHGERYVQIVWSTPEKKTYTSSEPATSFNGTYLESKASRFLSTPKKRNLSKGASSDGNRKLTEIWSFKKKKTPSMAAVVQQCSSQNQKSVISSKPKSKLTDYFHSKLDKQCT